MKSLNLYRGPAGGEGPEPPSCGIGNNSLYPICNIDLSRKSRNCDSANTGSGSAKSRLKKVVSHATLIWPLPLVYSYCPTPSVCVLAVLPLTGQETSYRACSGLYGMGCAKKHTHCTESLTWHKACTLRRTHTHESASAMGWRWQHFLEKKPKNQVECCQLEKSRG